MPDGKIEEHGETDWALAMGVGQPIEPIGKLVVGLIGNMYGE